MDFSKKISVWRYFEIKKVEKGTELADRLLKFVENFSWEEVKDHTLRMYISHQNMSVYMKSMDIVILRILLIMVMEQTDCMSKK